MLKKLSITLFVFSALISIFGATLPVAESFSYYYAPTLLILGIFIGLVNINQKEEKMFLISSVAFIFITETMTKYISNFYLLSQIFIIFKDSILFIGPAALTVATKCIIEFASENSEIKSKSNKRAYIKNKGSAFQDVWNIIIFLSVIFVFLTFVPQLFFDVTEYQTIINYVDLIIIIIFIIDLFFLYQESKSMEDFFKKNWLDILAAIPFNLILSPNLYFVKLLKLSRTTKIIRGISKFSKLNRPVKFFSKNSSFNRYVENKKK